MKLIGKRYKLLAAVLLFLFGTVYGVIAAEEQEMREVDKFQYQLENRPDPFLPFLSKTNDSNLMDDTPADEDTGKPLTGMQLFEPGQLRLVALLKVGGKNVAMVEDVTGKGYRLSENMLIGRHGIIDRITHEKVEITESYRTKTGRVVTKDIVMRLKKEGDK
ncbi:MAG: hypothetical protein D3904_01500 [Candidatus Electrothrix sp. EH2]|nr:hypothetical protein [Candidatus Electrothrix sp. EH2]